MIQLYKMAWRDLGRNRRRTFFSMLLRNTDRLACLNDRKGSFFWPYVNSIVE